MTAAANTLLDSVRPVWRSRGIPDWLVAYLFLAPAAAVFLGLITYPVLDGIHAAFTDRAIGRQGEWTGFANLPSCSRSCLSARGRKLAVPDPRRRCGEAGHRPRRRARPEPADALPRLLPCARVPALGGAWPDCRPLVEVALRRDVRRAQLSPARRRRRRSAGLFPVGPADRHGIDRGGDDMARPALFHHDVYRRPLCDPGRPLRGLGDRRRRHPATASGMSRCHSFATSSPSP